MIRVTIDLLPHGREQNKRELGRLEISNNLSGNLVHGNYNGVLHAEYTGPQGRRGSVLEFNRKTQSVWSLVGAFLKLWGHTSHSPKLLSSVPFEMPEEPGPQPKPAVAAEMFEAIANALGEAQVTLRTLLQERGVQVVTTNYSHSDNSGSDQDKIDGTQKKGVICNLTAPEPMGLIQRTLKFMLANVLLDIEKCPGANCYLLNFFNVEFNTRVARIVLRGCPAIAPDGFNYALASAELTAAPIILSRPTPYGFDLRCHPAFVKDCVAELDLPH